MSIYLIDPNRARLTATLNPMALKALTEEAESQSRPVGHILDNLVLEGIIKKHERRAKK